MISRKEKAMEQRQTERMRRDKGFIAALDQSGGSMPKALSLYGIPESSYYGQEERFALIHKNPNDYLPKTAKTRGSSDIRM
jgi:fructose-bisphosphate aldolase class 1